jgi:hypothetical protein
MGSHFKGKHLSREFVLEKTFTPRKHCGMAVSRRKLGWSQRVVDRELKVTMP